MDFGPSRTDDENLGRYVGLFRACFPGANKFDLPYLRWLYRENPDGAVVGFDAIEGGRLAAHYACIPATALIEGKPARVLLSLNTATHPDFQGKGLFTQLAQKTYDAAQATGFDAVYGVANANSTPGFTRKLGFQLVAPLEARVGVGRLLRNAADDADVAFRRTRSHESLTWRCTNPHNRVHLRRRGDVVQCFAAVAGSAFGAYHEYTGTEVDLATVHDHVHAPLARLFLGLVPAGVSGLYLPIPQRLRPSPLNLIYKPLASPVHSLDAARVRFAFIDFDAY
ncbi:MAG: GNAT family N-acetyltransferase [Burkholderiales bacterium]|nr:GNAT family N-acetyltransferase [Burkholderiales bacterium]